MEWPGHGTHPGQKGCGAGWQDFYKVQNNSQLETAQDSLLGFDIGGAEELVVSGIGQADDVLLLSNDIFALLNLLHFTLQYCERNHVTLRADKTKLQVFSNKNSEMDAFYARAVYGETINFSDEAEHVGITRSNSGNLMHLSSRFAAHKKSLAAVLPFGLARGHRGNPAASLCLNNLYATPVLLSGLGSLVLHNTEITMLDNYLKKTSPKIDGQNSLLHCFFPWWDTTWKILD